MPIFQMHLLVVHNVQVPQFHQLFFTFIDIGEFIHQLQIYDT